MSRGTYTVYKPQRPDSKRDSWRSCTCSVIIFVVLCLLILLVAWPLKHKNAENGPGYNNENIEGYSAAYKDSKSDAEIIPVNNTDNKETANVINQIPPSTTPRETEFTTTAFHKAHFAGTTQFHNFEESTRTPTTDEATTHRHFIEAKTVKTTNKGFIDRTLSESISTTETPIEKEEILNKTFPILFKNAPTPETHTETEETPTTHKSIPILLENVSTSETNTETEETPTIHKSIPIIFENVSTSETYTETEGTPTTHKFIPILLENVSISETHTKTEETPTTHISIPILLGNVPTSETHTKLEETPTTYKFIHSVGTEESQSYPDSFTTNSPEKYTSTGSILHEESPFTTEPTDKASTRMFWDHLKSNYISTTQDPKDTPIQNIVNSNMSSTTQAVTIESVILTEHSNIESFSSSFTQNDKNTTSSTLLPTTLSQNDTTENVKSVSRTFNNYHNIETTSNEPNALENSTLSILLSSVKDPTDKTFENVEIKSTEMTKSYEAAPTTPYAAPKTTTESSRLKFSPYQDITDEEETKVCDTNTCKNIASKSLSFMKHDENICEDFYSYACGGISKDYLVERDPSADFLKRLKGAIENTGNNSSKYAVALKNYFTSCMNYDYSKVKALDPAQEALKDVGLFCDKNTDPPSLTSLLTKLLKKNFPVLFDVRLDVDPGTKNLSLVILPVFPGMEYESLTRNKENEQLVIDKTKFGKGERNLTKAYTNHKDASIEISQYILEVRQALESFKVFDGKVGNNLLSEVLIFLELTILNAQNQALPTAIQRRRDYQYKIFTSKSLPNLQKSLNLVDWEELLTELVGPLPKDIHIQVYFVSYLSNVMNSLKTTDKRDMHNSVLALYTHHLYKQYVLDQKKIGERTSYCLKMSSKQMQDVSSALYLESFEGNKITDLYKHAEDIFERLVNTLYPEFNKDWLSEIKHEQLAKVTIGNLTLLSVEDHLPWKNPQDLIQRLEKYDGNVSCFIANTNALHVRKRELLYKQLGNDPMIPENLWTILYSPFETQLSIVKSLGRIVVPLGALPYYLDNPTYPKYVAMADLGFNIAKQINLYLELSSVRILKKNDGIQPENQLLDIKPSNDESPMFANINPSDLSTEIITDVAGAKLAYMAYKNYGSEILSQDLPVIWVNKTTGQLYFLLLAQQFCTKKSVSDDLLGLFEGTQLPPMIAMNSMAINTEEFYDLNGCNGDATMNAAIKVLLPSIASTTEMDPMDFSDR